MDVDLSQYCDVILLWNAAAMFLISFSTDYWEYRDYNYEKLKKDLSLLNNQYQRHQNGTVSTDGWDKFTWRNIIVVDVTFLTNDANNNNVLIGSNYDNCSALSAINFEWTINQRYKYGTSDVRKILRFKQRRSTGRIATSEYRSVANVEATTTTIISNSNINNNNNKTNHCFSSLKIYLFSEYANLFRECNDLQASETLAFAFGCLSATVSCLSLIFGTSGSIKRNPNCVYISALCLGLFALFYFATIVLFLVKTQLLQNLFKDDENVDDNELPLLSSAMKLVNANHTVTLGWSFVAAVLSLLMSIFAAQVYVSKGRRITKRRRSEIRRQRLEAALMSPCQQEVALALRAKMIVLHA